ncbi:hypothetical protein ADUPG1_003358, partial [Aduncisulcus paluster]
VRDHGREKRRYAEDDEKEAFERLFLRRVDELEKESEEERESSEVSRKDKDDYDSSSSGVIDSSSDIFAGIE